jgi:carbonic anhydrase
VPDAFADILIANKLYASSFRLNGIAAPAAKGLGVLTCIDSRIMPLHMLGLKPGDAKIFRNAGARATEDAIRSLILATHLLNVTRIMVVAHTDCAMAHEPEDALLARLSSAFPAGDFSNFKTFSSYDQESTLRQDVERLRTHALLAPETVVGGFIYDVSTGRLSQTV